MKSMPKQPDWFEPAHGGVQLCLLPVQPLVTGLGRQGRHPGSGWLCRRGISSQLKNSAFCSPAVSNRLRWRCFCDTFVDIYRSQVPFPRYLCTVDLCIAQLYSVQLYRAVPDLGPQLRCRSGLCPEAAERRPVELCRVSCVELETETRYVYRHGARARAPAPNVSSFTADDLLQLMELFRSGIAVCIIVMSIYSYTSIPNDSMYCMYCSGTHK